MKPNDSKASSSNFKAPVPNVFIIPIPLVAPIIELFETVPAAALRATPAAVVAAPPTVPVIIVDPFSAAVPFSVIAPILDPNALAKSDVTSTIKASMSTCLVFISISVSTASITSKSGLCPLTMIDRVVSSTVILILLIVAAPSAPCVENKSSKVALACAGLI